jgi:hypothetical protein
MNVPSLLGRSGVGAQILGLDHVHDHPVVPSSGALTLVRCLALAGIAVTAGFATMGPVAGVPTAGGRALARTAAGAAAVAPVMAIGLGGALPPGPAVLAIAMLALPMLLSRPRLAGGAGALAAVALLAQLGSSNATDGRHGLRPAAALILWAAATLWIGAVCRLVTARPGSRDRLRAWIAASTSVIALAGLVEALQNLWSASGALLAGVAGAGVLIFPARRLAWVRAGGLITSVLAVAAIVAVPPPAAPRPAGVPLLADVTLAGHAIPVLVAPARPGWSLVHVGADHASAGTDRRRLTAATSRPGAGLSWVSVWLRPGRNRLWIGSAGATAAVTVDTGHSGPGGPDLRGPDGPECASAALGRAMVGADVPLRSCAADRLTAEDAAALRAIVGFLAARRVRSIALVEDASARGRQASAVVRSAAALEHLAVLAPGAARVPLVVVSGWTGADRAVHDVSTGRTPAVGTYLAPWLLNAPLLSPPAGQLIPLRFATDDLPALQYVAALSARFPGEPASAGGYTGWLRAPAAAGTLRLYAASLIYVPGSDEHEGHDPAHWLPHGAVVAVTGPLAAS